MSRFTPTFTRILLLAACTLALPASSLRAVTTATWTGTTNNTLDTATNWSSGAVPGATNFIDTMQWNGSVAGNLALTYSSTLGGTSGVLLSLTSAQTGNVDLSSSATSSFRIQGVTIAAGAGAFSLGVTGSPLALNIGYGTGSTQTFSNDSTNTATIGSNATWAPGGSITHTLTFTGAGNWVVSGAMNTGASSSHFNLLKSGSGSLTLGGAVALGAGTTVVNSGTLLVNGTLASTSGTAVSVAATTAGTTAVLGGTGTISAVTTIGGASSLGTSILAPGTDGTIGTLSTAALTFAANSELKFELNSSTATIDFVTVAGTLTLGSGTTLLVGSDLGSSHLAANTVLVLAATTGLSGTFNGYADGSSIAIGSNTYQINYGTLSGYSNDITLTALAVPEPSTWALLALGLVAVVGMRRRRAPARA